MSGRDIDELETIRSQVKYCNVCQKLKWITDFNKKKLNSGNMSYCHYCKVCRARRSQKDYITRQKKRDEIRKKRENGELREFVALK